MRAASACAVTKAVCSRVAAAPVLKIETSVAITSNAIITCIICASPISISPFLFIISP